MDVRQNELRDELVAILGAGRELTPDVDRQLADAFLRYLAHHEEQLVPEVEPHQPHYSLKVAGGAWGAALMFLFLLLVLDDPNPVAFITASVVLLAIVALVTRAFLFLARYGWQVPRVQVHVTPRMRRLRDRN